MRRRSGWPVENDAEQVEHLAFLELRAAPDRGERRHSALVRAIAGPQPQDHRPVLQLHRVQMINDLQITRRVRFSTVSSISRSTPSITRLLCTVLLQHPCPASPRPVTFEAVVQPQLRIVAQKPRHRQRVLAVHQQRVLGRGAAVGNDLSTARPARPLRSAL